MAYPSTLDSFTDNVDNVDIITANDINELQTAIENIEAKVGVDSSAVNTTHDYKLSGVATGDKAVSKTGTETLTNKTLTSPTITSPTLNLGSDAEGDTYYRNSSGALVRLARGTDNYILKMNGNVPNWEAETATVDASTTAKGVVEAATSSEVTAGTATGGTGAVLVVTPDALASSTPVFNGSGLTNTKQGFIDSSTADSSAVTSTTTETTVATIAVPANTLGTNKLIRVRAHFVSGWTGDGNTTTYRFKYGGTTFCAFTIDPSGTPTVTVTIAMEGVIQGAGTTSSQEGYGTLIQTGETSGATPTAQPSSVLTASVDSTSSQNITITIQNGNNGSTQTTTLHNYSVEQIV